MPKTYFLIIGRSSDDSTMFEKHSSLGSDWVPDESQASHYDNHILCSPLPEGSVAIIELDQETGVPVRFYNIIDLPLVDIPLT